MKLLSCSLLLFSSLLFCAEETGLVHFANGFKIGELTPHSVVIWTRTTAHPQLEKFSPTDPSHNRHLKGQKCVMYATIREKKAVQTKTKFPGEIGPFYLTADNNYCLQIPFHNLQPETEYQVTFTGTKPWSAQTKTVHFTTPATEKKATPITFTISTCQEFELRDDPAKGHKIYQSMLRLKPDFFVQTGDTIYYDRKEPLAKTKELARYRWNRMYALPYQREFHNRIPTYWMHDDHDLLKDDCEPGDHYGELSWQDGIDLWNENIPQSEKPYRTFRWGKNLQIWLPEVRYFRSPKKMPDGPEKSILGKEQWAWLEKTMKASDATFKLYLSPTPVVGPDRKKKNDNHANQSFTFEGKRLRKFLSEIPGTFVINGDRHWQYHSIDPETGLQEFGAGPASDAHAQGWKPDDKRPEHQFLRVKGGFLSGQVTNQKLTLTHHDVNGQVTNTTQLAPPSTTINHSQQQQPQP